MSLDPIRSFFYGIYQGISSFNVTFFPNDTSEEQATEQQDDSVLSDSALLEDREAALRERATLFGSEMESGQHDLDVNDLETSLDPNNRQQIQQDSPAVENAEIEESGEQSPLINSSKNNQKLIDLNLDQFLEPLSPTNKEEVTTDETLKDEPSAQNESKIEGTVEEDQFVDVSSGQDEESEAVELTAATHLESPAEIEIEEKESEEFEITSSQDSNDDIILRQRAATLLMPPSLSYHTHSTPTVASSSVIDRRDAIDESIQNSDAAQLAAVNKEKRNLSRIRDMIKNSPQKNEESSFSERSQRASSSSEQTNEGSSSVETDDETETLTPKKITQGTPPTAPRKSRESSTHDDFSQRFAVTPQKNRKSSDSTEGVSKEEKKSENKKKRKQDEKSSSKNIDANKNDKKSEKKKKKKK